MTKQNEAHMTKQDLLLEHIKHEGIITSYDVKRYGMTLFLMDCDRRCREWVRAGILERLSAPQKKMMGIKPRFVAWRYIGTAEELQERISSVKVA